MTTAGVHSGQDSTGADSPGGIVGAEPSPERVDEVFVRDAGGHRAGRATGLLVSPGDNIASPGSRSSHRGWTSSCGGPTLGETNESSKARLSATLPSAARHRGSGRTGRIRPGRSVRWRSGSSRPDRSWISGVDITVAATCRQARGSLGRSPRPRGPSDKKVGKHADLTSTDSINPVSIGITWKKTAPVKTPVSTARWTSMTLDEFGRVRNMRVELKPGETRRTSLDESLQR